VRWVDYPKHVPPPRVPWTKLVEDSRDQVSYYHRDFRTPAARRRLENKCIREGNCFRNEEGGKRCFYLISERVVGASAGEETSYLYVEVVNDEFHGWPITPNELRKKGAEL